MDFFSFLTGLIVAFGAIWAVSHRMGFLAQAPDDYADGPTFDIRKTLNGPMLCDGVIYGPTGRVSSRFMAEFDAEWDGDTGVMRERFQYDSGTVQNREWRLSVDQNGLITAEADDLVGKGTGKQNGSGVQLEYTIELPESAGSHRLSVTDWMYLLDNGTIVNRSQFRKFGFKVGELVATVRPDPARAEKRKAA